MASSRVANMMPNRDPECDMTSVDLLSDADIFQRLLCCDNCMKCGYWVLLRFESLSMMIFLESVVCSWVLLELKW